MRDFEKLGMELLSSEKGKRLKEIANSKDGRELEKLVSGNDVQKALASGDMEALKGIMAKVLSTEQGKRIAEELSKK